MAPTGVVTPADEALHGPYDVIVELVGGQDCLQRVALLRSRGKSLVVGVQAGATVPLRMFDLMLVRGGRLRVPVDTAFSLDRHADGYARLAGSGKFGKVILTCG